MRRKTKKVHPISLLLVALLWIGLLSSCAASQGTPEELLAMSQQLDRLINHTMRVRSGHFACANLHALRPRRISRALP